MVSRGHIKFNRWLSFVGGGIFSIVFLIVNVVGFSNGKISLTNLLLFAAFLYTSIWGFKEIRKINLE